MIKQTEKRLANLQLWLDENGQKFLDDPEMVRYFLVPYQLSSEAKNRESLDDMWKMDWVDSQSKQLDEELERIRKKVESHDDESDTFLARISNYYIMNKDKMNKSENKDYIETDKNADKLMSEQERYLTENKKAKYDLNLLANKYEKLTSEFSRIKIKNDKQRELVPQNVYDLQCISMNKIDNQQDYEEQDMLVYYPVNQNLHELDIGINSQWMGYEQDILKEVERLDEIVKSDHIINQDKGDIEILFEKIESKTSIANFTEEDLEKQQTCPYDVLKVFEENRVQKKDFDILYNYDLNLKCVIGILKTLNVEDNYLDIVAGLSWWNGYMEEKTVQHTPEEYKIILKDSLEKEKPFSYNTITQLFEKEVQRLKSDTETFDKSDSISNLKVILTTVWLIIRENKDNAECFCQDFDFLGHFYDNLLVDNDFKMKNWQSYTQISGLCMSILNEFKNFNLGTNPQGEMLKNFLLFAQNSFKDQAEDTITASCQKFLVQNHENQSVPGTTLKGQVNSQLSYYRKCNEKIALAIVCYFNIVLKAYKKDWIVQPKDTDESPEEKSDFQDSIEDLEIFSKEQGLASQKSREDLFKENPQYNMLISQISSQEDIEISQEEYKGQFSICNDNIADYISYNYEIEDRVKTKYHNFLGLNNNISRVRMAYSK